MEAWILSIDWSRELQQKNLEWLDENLDSRKMPERAALMKRMGATTEEVIAWWEQYREDDEAYRPLLGLYEEYDLPKAIELVQEKRQEERITQKHWSGFMKRNCGIIRKAGRNVEIRMLS